MILPFPKMYLYAGLAAAAVAVFLYVRFLQARVDHWKGQHDQVQATLNVERVGHKLAMEANEKKRTDDRASAVKLRDETVERFQARIHTIASDADSLRVRLATASRLRTLAKAENAPVACRDFESGPDQLSMSDREILVRIAERANINASKHASCVAQYNDTVRIFGDAQ